MSSETWSRSWAAVFHLGFLSHLGSLTINPSQEDHQNFKKLLRVSDSWAGPPGARVPGNTRFFSPSLESRAGKMELCYPSCRYRRLSVGHLAAQHGRSGLVQTLWEGHAPHAMLWAESILILTPSLMDARAMAILQRENQGSEKRGGMPENMQKLGGSRPEHPPHPFCHQLPLLTLRRPEPGLSSVQDAPSTGNVALFLVPRPPRGHRTTRQDPRAGAAPTQGSWLKGALCWFFFKWRLISTLRDRSQTLPGPTSVGPHPRFPKALSHTVALLDAQCSRRPERTAGLQPTWQRLHLQKRGYFMVPTSRGR